jgi:hypothetical protein
LKGTGGIFGGARNLFDFFVCKRKEFDLLGPADGLETFFFLTETGWRLGGGTEMELVFLGFRNGTRGAGEHGGTPGME